MISEDGNDGSEYVSSRELSQRLAVFPFKRGPCGHACGFEAVRFRYWPQRHDSVPAKGGDRI